jgi:hypothetical protein
MGQRYPITIWFIDHSLKNITCFQTGTWYVRPVVRWTARLNNIGSWSLVRTTSYRGTCKYLVPRVVVALRDYDFPIEIAAHTDTPFVNLQD